MKKTPITPFNHLMTELEAVPPSWPWQEKRVQTFQKIGRFLEETIHAGQCFDLTLNPNPLWDAIYLRLTQAVLDLDAPAAKDGEWHLLQMYNAGLLITDGDVMFGVDVVPVLRTYGWPDPADLTRKIAERMDFLLITHHHPDHYDRALVRACLALGKPVCLPEDLRSEWESDPNLIFLRDGHSLNLCDMEITGRRCIHVWRKTAEELALIYYELTDRAGRTLFFAGDADYTQSFFASPGKSVDALFLPWRNPNARYEDGHPEQTGVIEEALRIAIDRLHPRRIILEHYAELEHLYQHYPASYDLAARQKKASDVPLEWLFWGERMVLIPALSAHQPPV